MATKEWRADNRDRERTSRRKWYRKNSQHAVAKVIERRKSLRDWLTAQKVRCARCPENDSVCLDFHHRDGSTKEVTLSKAIQRGWSVKRMQAEIEKCDVLCSNCHRKEHRPCASAGERVSKTLSAGSTPDAVAI